MGMKKEKMKFVISYSCGKDSTLALHKMLQQGHKPVGLLVMVNKEMKRSWFHGVDLELLKAISNSLEIPMIQCESCGEEYHLALEEGLRVAKKQGAEVCVFGDIDIEDHLAWCKARCEAVQMKSIFPLWKRDRVENTMEIISLGYQCLIKCVRNADLPKEFLGRMLDQEMVDYMNEKGIDACGENGEYHTVVVGGPIFHKEILYECKETIDFGNISVVNIERKNESKTTFKPQDNATRAESAAMISSLMKNNI